MQCFGCRIGTASTASFHAQSVRSTGACFVLVYTSASVGILPRPKSRMPYSSAKQTAWNRLRRHTRGVVNLAHGRYCDEAEQWARRVASAILSKCSAGDVARLQGDVMPDWITEALIRQLWFQGFGEEHPEAEDPEAAPVAEDPAPKVLLPKGRARSRGLDLFLAENRELLQAKVSENVQPRTHDFRAAWRKEGVNLFGKLSKEEQAVYIARRSKH